MCWVICVLTQPSAGLKDGSSFCFSRQLEVEFVFVSSVRVMLWFCVLFSRVSRASHPPGSSEGTSLASEVLRRFRQLQMDHTWTESLYATLQFPHR